MCGTCISVERLCFRRYSVARTRISLQSRTARIVAALQPGCEEMEREWGNEEEMERKWGNGERLTFYISSFSLYFLPLSPFPPSLSISYIKMHHILLQNVKYGTFVANVTKISIYALWGNNSGSNLLRGSSAIRAGLSVTMSLIALVETGLMWPWRVKITQHLQKSCNLSLPYIDVDDDGTSMSKNVPFQIAKMRWNNLSQFEQIQTWFN